MDEAQDSPGVRGKACMDVRPEPCGLVIFGASGDLTHRKLIPSLFSLFRRNLLPPEFFILGCARTEMTDEEFQKKTRESIVSHFADVATADLDTFVGRVAYHSGDYTAIETYTSLSMRLGQLDQEHSIGGNRIFYLATPPSLYSVYIDAGMPTDPIPERRPESKQSGEAELETAEEDQDAESDEIKVWRCQVCGYLCARTKAPPVCPICRAKRERFEEFHL